MVDIPYPNGLGACMARAGFTDPGLAEAAGTTKQQIHKLRHGERKLTVQWAKRLAPILECTWQELIEGPDEPDDPQRLALLAVYDAMSDEQRRMLIAMGKAAVGFEPVSDPPAAVFDAMDKEQRQALLVMARGMAPQPEAGSPGLPKQKGRSRKFAEAMLRFAGLDDMSLALEEARLQEALHQLRAKRAGLSKAKIDAPAPTGKRHPAAWGVPATRTGGR